MEKVTITLDGREATGHPGMTILDLARETGANIPTLCNHPYLAPTGACRLCLVEDERSGALLVSCVTQLQPGMLINTQSPRVAERRRAIVELLLASHPDTCMVCDKGNRCDLRQIASDMGIGQPSFEKIPQGGAIVDLNPFFVRDMGKCILCGRCIRADQELVVEGAIDYLGRGFLTRPATVGDVPLEGSECTFCGTCVAMCPTGALMEKDAASTGTTATAVTTTCPFCGCGCSVTLEIKEGTIVRARPGDEGPVNRGTLCVRGSYGYDFVHSPERLTTPLVRTEEGLTPASWDDALGLVAARFAEIKSKDGPGSLAVLGSPAGTNEENYLLQRFARCVLGTPNIDNGTRLSSAASCAGLGGTVGYPSTVGTLADLEAAEVILVVGADLAAAAPAAGYAVKRAVTRRGARLILVDPRRTPLSHFAHLWLRPRPGSDVALLNGMARVIADEDLLDEEFVARKTDGFDDLYDGLDDCTPETVEGLTGVPWSDVQQAARIFGSAQGAAIVYGNGVTRSERATDTVSALANLALLTGNLERKGTGIFALQSDCNGLGACDMGAVPDFLPGYCCVADEEGRQRFEEHWGTAVPTGPGLSALEMVAAAAAGDLKGLYLVGENPVLAFPDPDATRAALSALDFLVVQDLFLTETAALATVVLPSASFAEKQGSFTNLEGRIQPVRPALPPAGESRPDGAIILDLAERMGSPFPYAALGDVTAEIAEFVPFYEDVAEGSSATAGGAATAVSGTGDGTRRRRGTSAAARAAVDAAAAAGAAQHDGGAPWERRRLYERYFPSGFGRFASVDSTPAAGAGDGFPFVLLTGSTLFHFGTGSRSTHSRRLHTFLPASFIQVNEADAGRLDIDDGDEVTVRSAFGEMHAAARLDDGLPAGTLFTPLSFPGSPVNALFPVALDAVAKTPAMGHCAVRLERRHADDRPVAAETSA